MRLGGRARPSVAPFSRRSSVAVRSLVSLMTMIGGGSSVLDTSSRRRKAEGSSNSVREVCKPRRIASIARIASESIAKLPRHSTSKPPPRKRINALVKSGSLLTNRIRIKSRILISQRLGKVRDKVEIQHRREQPMPGGSRNVHHAGSHGSWTPHPTLFRTATGTSEFGGDTELPGMIPPQGQEASQNCHLRFSPLWVTSTPKLPESRPCGNILAYFWRLTAKRNVS